MTKDYPNMKFRPFRLNFDQIEIAQRPNLGQKMGKIDFFGIQQTNFKLKTPRKPLF